jgi:DNA-binding response OmpR family regulator
MNNTIVEDDAPIRNVVEKAFIKHGYTVQSAESAEAALEILKQENIQVMFLDLKLPGISGVDLCKQIRKDKPIAIIYAITGYTSLFELGECREAGFDDYFAKPVELEILWKAARDAFEKLGRWEKE